MIRNLIIGAAFSYDVAQIAPFVKSLRKHYDDNVILLVQNVDKETREFYNEYRIGTYEVTAEINYGTVNVTRFEMYNNLIKSIEPSQSGKIFITDTRDVIFQSNPFANTDSHNLYLYAEPEMIGACDINSGWYKELLGEAEFEKVKSKLIICGGSVLGSREAVINLIEIFWTELMALASKSYVSGKCDQALLNYLAYNKLADWSLGETYSSNVATLHHAKTFSFNIEGQMLNTNGEPIPVLHQYDRHAGFKELILRQV